MSTVKPQGTHKADAHLAAPSEVHSTEAANTAIRIDEMLPCVRIPPVVSWDQSWNRSRDTGGDQREVYALNIINLCGLSGGETRRKITNLEHANKSRYKGTKD